MYITRVWKYPTGARSIPQTAIRKCVVVAFNLYSSVKIETVELHKAATRFIHSACFDHHYGAPICYNTNY